ncbi:MAG: electron transport complex subunit E [Bacillota bacterium]
MDRVWRDFSQGILKNNAILRLVLGMCPALAVTTAAVNGLGMGLASTAVLVMSNFIISILRNLIPEKIRIPCFIVVIASFVTIVDLIMEAFVPQLHQALGIFIPLIVVNCLILGRAEAFASRNPVVNSIADGLGMGLGFTLSLTVLASVREILGAGTVFGLAVLGPTFQPALLMIMPPGAFLTLGLMVGFINWWDARREKMKEDARKGVAVGG